MSNSIAIQPEQFIFAQNNELKTTSLKVAEAFGKLHKDVLRKVDSLDCSKEFSQRNFTLCRKNNELQNGKPQPFYELTKDGFMFLVMSFTGKKAASIKEAYINAFNEMHKKLFPVQNALVQLQPLTPAQKNHIQNEVKRLVNTQVGTTYRSMWSTIKDHFKVGTYKEIPSARYIEVCQFLKCEPIEGELLPAIDLPDVPEGKDYQSAMLLITRLRGFAGFAVPSSMLNEMNSDLDKLDNCLVSAFTEMDEAMLHIGHAQSFLKRWRGDK